MDQFTVSRHLVHSRNRPMHQPFTTTNAPSSTRGSTYTYIHRPQPLSCASSSESAHV